MNEVEDYIINVPEDVQEILRKIRKQIIDIHVGKAGGISLKNMM